MINIIGVNACDGTHEIFSSLYCHFLKPNELSVRFSFFGYENDHQNNLVISRCIWESQDCVHSLFSIYFSVLLNLFLAKKSNGSTEQKCQLLAELKKNISSSLKWFSGFEQHVSVRDIAA